MFYGHVLIFRQCTCAPSHEHRWAPELGKQAEDASLLQHWVDSGINSAARFGLCHVCEEHRSHKSSPQWLSHKSKPTAAASRAWRWDARTTLLCKAMVASYRQPNCSGAAFGLLWVKLGTKLLWSSFRVALGHSGNSGNCQGLSNSEPRRNKTSVSPHAAGKELIQCSQHCSLSAVHK